MSCAPDSLPRFASLGDSLAVLVQGMQAASKKQGSALYFDYLGLTMFPIRDVQALARCVHGMLDKGLSEAQHEHGSLFLTVHARPLSTDRALVTVRLAYTVRFGEGDLNKLSSMSRQPTSSILHEGGELSGLDWQALRAAFGDAADLACVQFLSPQEGAVIELSLSLPHGGADAEPAGLTELATVSAWLIGPLSEDGTLLAERLQRDGWLVRQFADIDDALRFWGASQGRLEPALLVVTEPGATNLAALSAARGTWSPQCRVVYGVDADRDVQASGQGIEILKIPFSPADLRGLKDLASTLEAARKAQSRLQKRDGARLRPIALVVDGSPVNRVLAAEMLKVLGYDCDTADNGREAVEYVERYRPDVIVMDLEMPIMDGMEATERIRRYEMHGAGMYAPVPIIASTARDEQDVATSWQAIGMSAFVPKPLTLERLAAALSAGLPDQAARR